MLDTDQRHVFASESRLPDLDVARVLKTFANLFRGKHNTDSSAALQDERGHGTGYDAFRPTPTSNPDSRGSVSRSESKIPERLTHVGIVSGVAPFDRLGVEEQRQRETCVDRRAPWLGRARTAAMAVAARRWPNWTYEQVLRDMPEPDRIIASRAEVRAVLLEALLEAVRSGTRGVECERAIHAKPWGFQPEHIPIEIKLWHGDQDTSVPLSQAELLAEAIPNSHLSVCAGAGHLLIDAYFQEILSAMTR